MLLIYSVFLKPFVIYVYTETKQVLLFLIYCAKLDYTFLEHLNYRMAEVQITFHKELHQDTTSQLIYHTPKNKKNVQS